MSTPLTASVGLLDRALGYTRARLWEARATPLDRPTPCSRWTLAELLWHLEDALDAVTEAAAGAIGADARRPPRPVAGQVDDLRRKAGDLIGAWAGPAPGDVVLRGHRGALDLSTPVLVEAAALEITVHGWDIGQATGAATPIPQPLARDLLPVAHRLVLPAERGVRFAAPRPVPAQAPYDVRLLAFVGRT